MTTTTKKSHLLTAEMLKRAVIDAFWKLDPRVQFKNPVMFVVEIGSLLMTLLFIQAAFGSGEMPTGYILAISLWLWFTVLFANFAEAVAEGRGKAQAAELRRSRRESSAKKLAKPEYGAKHQVVPGNSLRKGDAVLVEAGDTIPSDGEIVEGIASVNEAAITGESAPVIRESGGDRSAVTGGTQVLSDWIRVRITAAPGSTFLGRDYWRTPANTESKLLFLRYCFETLGCVRVALKTDGRNIRSQEALTRLGAVREGTLRKHMKVRGYQRDTVYFSILDTEWPAVASRLSARLYT